MSNNVQHPAVVALITLEKRLALISSLCNNGVPTDSVGEQLKLMRRMPEWDVVRMTLPATLEPDGADPEPVAPAPVSAEVWPDSIDDMLVEAFASFRLAKKAERGGAPGAIVVTPMEAFAAGRKSVVMEPVHTVSTTIPPGWTIRRSDQPPFKYISIESPSGARVRVSNVSRAPENVLYMLGDALLNIQPDDEPAKPAEARCARCQGGMDLPNRKCPAGQPDCAVYPGWNTPAGAA